MNIMHPKKSKTLMIAHIQRQTANYVITNARSITLKNIDSPNLQGVTTVRLRLDKLV